MFRHRDCFAAEWSKSDAGKWVRVLPGADVDGPSMHALIPLGQRMGAKTRAVLCAPAED